jgi:hypothetical protein
MKPDENRPIYSLLLLVVDGVLKASYRRREHLSLFVSVIFVEVGE